MSKIFISYAYADGADMARQLVSELDAAGSPCWMGQRDMKTGEDFPAQIVAAIKESRGLVVLLTPGANGSRDVLQEVSLAHNAKKPLVPLIVRNTSPSGGSPITWESCSRLPGMIQEPPRQLCEPYSRAAQSESAVRNTRLLQVEAC